MKTTCPHCSQQFSIRPYLIGALRQPLAVLDLCRVHFQRTTGPDHVTRRQVEAMIAKVKLEGLFEGQPDPEPEPEFFRIYIPGPPVGLEHEGGRTQAGKHYRYTEPKSRAYMKHCGNLAMSAIAVQNQRGKWPTSDLVFMDLEIYFLSNKGRPDPLNVADSIQDGFSRVLWQNDRNVLARVQKVWWPGLDDNEPPAQLRASGRPDGVFRGGVCVTIRKI